MWFHILNALCSLYTKNPQNVEFVSRIEYWKFIENIVGGRPRNRWEVGLEIGGRWDIEVGCVRQ